MRWFLKVLEQLGADYHAKGDEIDFTFNGEQYRADVMGERVWVQSKSVALSMTENCDIKKILEVQ